MTPEQSKPNPQEILETYKNLVWPEINSYLKDPTFPPSFRIPNRYREDVTHNWEIAKEYPLRKGKYLRPTLVMITAEALGSDRKSAIKTAAAMQVSEDWLLIHDDFEDNSSARRGKPTLHKIYGPELAVNAGDLLHV